ncbi:hypothetical protein APHAL10511_003474 [Amanita phalloides]|nr:hypothetical protein APHAL10511_003474 [Amanita phalloides]
MKSISSAAALLASACFVSAATPQLVSFTNNSPVPSGAAYFLSNEPSGNYLFAAAIGSNAQLTLEKGYYTGGKGAHAVGFNALFSQGAVVVHQNLSAVFTVNAGSNSISAFAIDPAVPTNLKMVGQPVSSGGDFPISIAVNSQGSMVCALNGGTKDGISCFTFSPSSGLKPIPDTYRNLNLNQTTPPVGPDTTFGQIIFADNDTKLVVSVKGVSESPLNIPGFIALWDVYPDMSLSIGYSPIIGGVWPWGLSALPGRNVIVASDGITGINVYDVDAWSHQPMTQASLYLPPMEFKGALCWNTYSDATGNFYFVDTLGSNVYEVHIDQDSLAPRLVTSYALQAYQGLKTNDVPTDISVTTVSGVDRMYVLASNKTSIAVYSLSGAGQGILEQRMDFEAPIVGARLALNRDNVLGLATYVINA